MEHQIPSPSIFLVEDNNNIVNTVSNPFNPKYLQWYSPYRVPLSGACHTGL